MKVKLVQALGEPAVRAVRLVHSSEALLVHHSLKLVSVLQQLLSQGTQLCHPLLLLEEREEIERLSQIEWRCTLQWKGLVLVADHAPPRRALTWY